VLDEERDEARKRETLPFGEVERLVELLKGSGVGEIRVRSGDLEISVKARPEMTQPAPATIPPAVASEPAAEPEAVAETVGEDGSHMVRSPLVGTFYRAPAPGEGPYVEVGDVVVEGQTLCIVEAMKMMNEIPSDVSGEVVEVVAENAKGVEYDQPLFRIRPVA
jgi:acetyl-CoA carboxylase biotin carboxyl carrier protein